MIYRVEEDKVSRRRIIWLLPLSIPSVNSTPATHRETERERKLVTGEEEERVSEELNHTTARMPGPL
jgi:hypothetical protein